MNLTVGIEPVDGHWWVRRKQMEDAFGGFWYSTPRRAQCPPGVRPRGGTGCAWAVTAPPSFINASCMVRRLLPVVERSNPRCFANCSTPFNHSDPCWRGCVEDAVLGRTVPAVDAQLLVAEWQRAFGSEAGCPPVEVRTATDGAMPHPGGWHTAGDVARIRRLYAEQRPPYAAAAQLLMNDTSLAADFKPSPAALVCRTCCDSPCCAPGKPCSAADSNGLEKDASECGPPPPRPRGAPDGPGQWRPTC